MNKFMCVYFIVVERFYNLYYADEKYFKNVNKLNFYLKFLSTQIIIMRVLISIF